jgi:plastocyanin
MKKKPIIAAVLVVIVLIVAVVVIMAKGNQGDMSMAPSSATATSATMTNQVAIQNYMFSPMAITVKVGTTVTWTNKDSVSHTITADNVSSDAPSSMDIADGKSYSFTFKKAGTYTYHCFPHPYMHGMVIVKG